MAYDLNHDDPASAADAMCNRLQNALSLGAYAPGEELSADKIAAQFQVRPDLARLALARIAQSEILTVANRRYFVPLLTRSSTVRVMRARASIESNAAMLACARASGEAVKELTDLAVVLAAAADAHTFFVAHRSFHFLIYEATELETVLEAIGAMWATVGPQERRMAECVFARGEPEARAAIWRHTEIALAMALGQPKSVFECMNRHIAAIGEATLASLR